jgi:hypothetical protein
MTSDCEECGYDILECACLRKAEDDIKNATRYAFHMFMIDVLEKYAPKRVKYLPFDESVRFVFDWIEKNFDD